LADAIPDGFHQFREEEEVVLEKRVRRDFPSLRGDTESHLDPAFRRRMRAHLFDLLVNGGLGDFALLDIDDEAVVGADKANVEPLFEFVPLAANHDAIAVTVGLRAGNDRSDHLAREAANALEEVGDLFVFNF